MNPIVKELVMNGIHVTIIKDKNKEEGFYYDLNLLAKSHMYLYKKDEKIYIDMRYDETYQVENIDDVCYYALRGMHGRDYINLSWYELLVGKGLLK